MTDFDAEIIHWKTLEEFTAHLATVPRPAWCQGVTDHNTYIPNERQWAGMDSMRSMMKTYIDKGWSAGPHLYLAAEAPNPADQGIWQMTPLSHVGVHAGGCNKDHTGIENVGDFEARPPSPAQWALCVAVNVAICRAWRLPASAILVHRECMPQRTCPGRFFSAEKLRADVNNALMVPTAGQYRIAGTPIYYDSLLTRPSGAYLESGAEVAIDATAVDNPKQYHPRAGHLASGAGFINLDGADQL